MYMHICSDIYMSVIAHVKKSWPFGCNNVLLKKKKRQPRIITLQTNAELLPSNHDKGRH